MNNNTHHHAALHLSSLAIAAVAMAITLNSCQDYEYGFTEEEIHQDAVQREYNKEFLKAFPEVDPDHTWMCEPDVYTSGLATRATANLEQPKFTGEYQDVSIEETWAVLEYMKEGQPNGDGVKATVNFEYYAVEETTYEIIPMFWGEKFCKYNDVGFYYIDDNGRHTIDMNANVKGFWTDRPNQNQTVDGKKGDIFIVYKDGYREPMPETSHPIGKVTTGYEKDPKNYADLTKDCWNHKGYPCEYCGGTGKVGIDHIEMPKFTITVPAGIKWGLCLTTQRNQNDKNDLVTWYSNADYNVNKVPAAASFTYAGVSYVSFEDAPDPYGCNIPNGDGNHQCGHGDPHKYGHYDHDYNDIVLCITPRPIESTYDYKTVRVMCEDLGGTFDWDFNDLVYDLKYETDGHSLNQVIVTLRAIGGTLPIYAIADGQTINLHERKGQQPNKDGLYEPILERLDIELFKFTNLTNEEKKDFRKTVYRIKIKVQDSEYNYHIIKFPDEGGDKIPQCFMTSTGTAWSPELVNIKETYPQFTSWVADQGTNNWWNTNPNF